MPIQILKIPSVTKRNQQPNCSNQRISANIIGQSCWGKVFLQCKYLSNVDINYITVITVKRAIINFLIFFFTSFHGANFRPFTKNAPYLSFLHSNLKSQLYVTGQCNYITDSNSPAYTASDIVEHKFHSCGRSLKYISF